MYTLLPEWLDANAHRQFPLLDTMTGVDNSGSFQLPQDFIVDIFLNVPSSSETDKFFVSQIVVRRYTAEVSISYNGDTTFKIGSFQNISLSADSNTVYNFTASTQSDSDNSEFETVTGVIVVGNPSTISTYPGEWTFIYDNSQIIDTCIAKGLVGVRQISVGADIFSGKVILKEGDNISITTEYDGDEDATVITISAANTAFTDITSLTSDSDIMNTLISEYGQPITKINNIEPASDGNFSLVGVDCIEVDNLSGGLGLNNPCGTPCCDKDHLEAVYDSIAELNSRYGRLNEFFTNLSTQQNEMQNKQGILQMNLEQP